MVIKASVKNTIKKFCREVEKQGYPLKQVVLFGSYAKGARQFNDIDLALFSNYFGKDRIAELMFLNKIASQFNLPLDPIPFHLSDLQDRYSTLIAEVKKSGYTLKFV